MINVIAVTCRKCKGIVCFVDKEKSSCSCETPEFISYSVNAEAVRGGQGGYYDGKKLNNSAAINMTSNEEFLNKMLPAGCNGENKVSVDYNDLISLIELAKGKTNG